MTDRVHQSPNLIYSLGTQVVSRRDIVAADGTVLHPRGSVGVVERDPADLDHCYRIRFADGHEASVARDDIVMLALYQEGNFSLPGPAHSHLYDRVFFKCIIGSRAYGLDDDQSDTDYRGIHLSTAGQHWSLAGVPEQIENDAM